MLDDEITGKRAYKTVKNFFGVSTPKCGARENKDIEIIYEQELIVDR